MTVAQDDTDLLKRVADGDDVAFERIYRAHCGRVAGHIRAVVGPSSDVEDLVQVAFLRIHQRAHQFRGESKVTTWLYRIAANVAVDALRSRARKARLQEANRHHREASAPEPNPHDLVALKVEAQAYYDILGQLSEKKRAVFVLHEIEERTLAEVAELIGVPMFTVASRLRSARQQILKAVQRRLSRKGRRP